ncbi:MAG: hypothetical protein LBS46_09020 [Dysgonamonadaceae bacterium]|jgi:hypothetical protein|nr:hypothetical protein [Dysgonamonadaceae bacterium]
MNLQQKNQLLGLYYSSLLPDIDILDDFKTKNNIENFDEIIDEIKNIEISIYDYIWENTKPDKQLSASEIEEKFDSYCFEHYQWIDEAGLKSLKYCLMYMCWHEGVLK